MAYLSLFLVSLVAATILPAQSEAVLVGLIMTGSYNVYLLLFVASAGNILGSIVNWMLGRGIENFKHRAWFPVSPKRLEQASILYKRYGRFLLLLSWVPIIGDPITVVAGILRERFFVFIILVSVAKITRYAIIAAITLKLIN